MVVPADYELIRQRARRAQEAMDLFLRDWITNEREICHTEFAVCDCEDVELMRAVRYRLAALEDLETSVESLIYEGTKMAREH